MGKSTILKKFTRLTVWKYAVVSVFCALIGTAVTATPVEVDWKAGETVEVDWKAGETMPAKVARPFSGFLSDGRFLVAGGSYFEDGKKMYSADITVRELNGKWGNVGDLPRAVAEGVSCVVEIDKKGFVFCAGGTDGQSSFSDAFALSFSGEIGLPGAALDTKWLPALPEPVVMGAAAADGAKVYVVAAKNVYALDLAAEKGEWRLVAELPGPARAQMVAAIQNGDQKEKMLVVYGGFDTATKQPLHDGYGLVLSTGEWKTLSPLPENTTTIGAAFLPSGHQHILLVGGFGEKGWIDRAINGSTEADPVKLGWQRKVLAYNCVTDAWCEYGEIAAADSPRCGAAAGIRPGKTPEQYTLLLAGGEIAPATRTDAVSVASFRKTGKFGAMAWAVVGVYALLMVGMACFFIFKKKDENDYFRGGNRIPWYVAGMSIFATMLSSITFIAIPTQAYLQDWRYFVMAFFIIGMAPVAIYYYLPFFCRLGITSAYEYLEKRFNLGVRLFGSAAFVVFMVCRVAVVTLLPAIALNAVTGISIDACILICGILTMIYCSLGGLEAVIWSDFVQGIVLMGGAVSVLVLLIMKTGGDGAHFSTFWNVASSYNKNTMWDFRFILTQPVFWVVAVQGPTTRTRCGISASS